MDRRKFFKQSLMVSSGLILAPLYVSCSDDDFVPAEEGFNPVDFEVKNFNHGVASFDPVSDSVIIWTRFDATSANTTICWEFATDSEFNAILRSGEINITAEFDYTLNVDVTELPSNTKFYYRFYEKTTFSMSVVGETITLPDTSDAINEMKLAVASCSNYAAGLFNVYDAMANSDADVIVHLGDYIYEYEVGNFGTNANGINTAALGREHEPSNEIISLEDYRTRYKQYRSDVSLQLAHQKKPFIAVWDDHEVTNDTFSGGAENHQEDEGSFETRKQTAIKVYSEYMPVRTSDPSIIYRSFNFGNIMSLHMLDTRIIGRDQQLEFVNFFDQTGNFDFASFVTALADTNRRLLGNEQINWLSNSLNNSSTWQVLGQQVLMARMFVPAELLVNLGASPEVLQQTIVDLTTIKARLLQGDPTLTAAETARVTTVAPYNLDAWDGYAAEREAVLSLFEGKKVINLAGDTHNAWYSNITNLQGDTVATELACSSVSSPGFEDFLNLTTQEAIVGFQSALEFLIDDLIYTDSSRRGYLKVSFSNSSVIAEWNFIDNLGSEEYTVISDNTVTIS